MEKKKLNNKAEKAVIENKVEKPKAVKKKSITMSGHTYYDIESFAKGRNITLSDAEYFWNKLAK